jgi:hypothetical protein
MYRYIWGNNEKRKTLKGRLCNVMAKGKKNSLLIEFTDNGQKEIVSRYSVRKEIENHP